MWSIEAEELKKESYGVELLQAVGVVYQMKVRQLRIFRFRTCADGLVRRAVQVS